MTQILTIKYHSIISNIYFIFLDHQLFFIIYIHFLYINLNFIIGKDTLGYYLSNNL